MRIIYSSRSLAITVRFIVFSWLLFLLFSSSQIWTELTGFQFFLPFSIVHFSRCRCYLVFRAGFKVFWSSSLSRTAYLLYHIFLGLSSGFSKVFSNYFFKISLKNKFIKILKFRFSQYSAVSAVRSLSLSSDSFIIIARFLHFVKPKIPCWNSSFLHTFSNSGSLPSLLSYYKSDGHAKYMTIL